MAEVAGAHDAVTDAARRDCTGHRIVAPSTTAGEYEPQRGMARRDTRERVDEPWNVLTRLDRPRKRDVWRRDARPGERGEVGSFVPGGRESLVVDTVVDHHHLGGAVRARGPRRESVRSVFADAHAHRRVRDRRRDHPTEEDDLRSFVPLGMLEEREVVHRHDHRDARAQREGVVRSVPHVDPELPDESWPSELLPRQPHRPRTGHDCVHLTLRRDRSPAGAVTSPGEQHEVDGRVATEAPGQLHDVDAGAPRVRRDRRHVEQDPHRKKLQDT